MNINTSPIEFYARVEQNLETQMCDVDNQPICFVEIDPKTATVKKDSAFKCMIVGFGKVGQTAFRHIYSLAAFVDSEGNKTPFHCTIIDKNADVEEENLLSKAPYFTSDKGRSEVSFVNCTVGDETYYNTIKEEILEGLNYIVVATGEDELNNHIKATIQNYLQENQAESTNKKTIKICICNSILSDSIDNQVIAKAIEFNYEYEKDGASAYDKWLKTIGALGNKSPEDAEFDKALCIANSMHSATKIKLLEATGRPIEYWEGKLQRNKVVNPDNGNMAIGATYIDPRLSDEEKQCLVNVAVCEHELWMAIAHLFGFTLSEKDADGIRRTDKSKKLHRDLVHWNELREWDKTMQDICRGYDCAVVDTTIKLAIHKK